jgi:hypothetical protein
MWGIHVRTPLTSSHLSAGPARAGENISSGRVYPDRQVNPGRQDRCKPLPSVLEGMAEWQSRPLVAVCPVVSIDAIP